MPVRYAKLSRQAIALALLIAAVMSCASSRLNSAVAAKPGSTTSTTSTTTTTSTTSSTTTTSISTTTTTATTSPPATTTSVPQSTTTVATTTSVATTPSTTVVAPVIPEPGPPFALPGIDIGDYQLSNLAAAYNRLLWHNLAASVTVIRDHVIVFSAANGLTATWQQITPDSPMVIASVSKLVTALSLARLAQQGLVNVDAPMPWDSLGIAHHAAWNDVTVRELLTHTGGMPINRTSWLDDPGTCDIPLTAAMADPPRASRGKWTYSNGNYCALGLLAQAAFGQDLGAAARTLIFDQVGIAGPHLTTDPHADVDGPYPLGLGRLQRLGGAGTWMISTTGGGTMRYLVTPADLATMIPPGIIVDQYGWGHTGTVDGAKACAWIVEGGRTVVAATVAGNSPSSGGGVCDIIVPALAADLGFWADRPIRVP